MGCGFSDRGTGVAGGWLAVDLAASRPSHSLQNISGGQGKRERKLLHRHYWESSGQE